MNKDKFLKIVCKQIRFGWDRDIVSRELEVHIEDSILDLIDEGYSKEEAEKKAIEQMGDPIEIGKQLNEEHKPLLGWLWLISKVLVFLLILPTLIFTQNIGDDIFQYLKPIVSVEIDETIQIDETIYLEAHTVIIDDILQKDDLYCITYHAKAKWNVNKLGVIDYLFHIKDEEGNILDGPDKAKKFYNTIIGCKGSKWFEIPSNKKIYLEFTNGKILKIDLKEYQYE